MKKLIAIIAVAATMCGCSILSVTTVEQKASLAKSATTVATAVIVQTKSFTDDVKTVSVDVATTLKTELAKINENGYAFYKNLYPTAEKVIDAKLTDEAGKSTAKILATTVLNILDTIESKYKVENIEDIKLIADSVIDGFLNGVNYKLTNDEKVSVARFSAQRLGVPEPEGL